MPMYAIAFDLDTKAMNADGLNQSDITNIYQREIPRALEKCGFYKHPQGSLYHTEISDDNPLSALVAMKSILQSQAPHFCIYATNIMVFRMDDWSDVTNILQLPRPAHNVSPTPNITIDSFCH